MTTQIYINCEPNGTLTGQTFDIEINGKNVAKQISEGELNDLLRTGRNAITLRMINSSMGIKP